MHDVTVIDEPAAAEARWTRPRPALAEAGQPGSASTLAPRWDSAGRRPTITCGNSSATGWWSSSRSAAKATHRAGAPGHGRLLCDLPRAAGCRARSGAGAGQRSARWLLALAGRMLREVGELITGATAAGKPLATFGIDSEVRFASAKERAAFAIELADAVNGSSRSTTMRQALRGRRLTASSSPCIHTITSQKEPQS